MLVSVHSSSNSDYKITNYFCNLQKNHTLFPEYFLMLSCSYLFEGEGTEVFREVEVWIFYRDWVVGDKMRFWKEIAAFVEISSCLQSAKIRNIIIVKYFSWNYNHNGKIEDN